MNTDSLPFIHKHALGTGIYGFGVDPRLDTAVPFLPGPLAIQHAGIDDAAGHEDIQAAHGTDFYLPAGLWVMTQRYLGDGWGWTYAFRPTGERGEIVFMHMATVNGRMWVGGGAYRGGSWIGTSGGVPDVDPGVDANHSQGAHLHVAYSGDVERYIKHVYGKRPFVTRVHDWAYGQPMQYGGRVFRRGDVHYV